jgi:nitrite reductase/ring-hydroxylating ferredoxin subunit
VSGTWVPTHACDAVQERPLPFEHGGLRILVAVIDGQPRAVDDACLHRGASLSGGVCRDGIITCPSHWWRYDLRDGALQGSPGAHLTTFACRVVDGVVEVLLPPPAPQQSLREILLAHAHETRPAHA